MKRSSEYSPAHAHPRRRPTYRPRRDAGVIPLHARRGHTAVGPIVGLGLLAIAAWTFMASLLALLARSGRDVIGQLVPGWPWW
jgi:hypothetical protein